jgi:hypothetical protein
MKSYSVIGILKSVQFFPIILILFLFIKLFEYLEYKDRNSILGYALYDNENSLNGKTYTNCIKELKHYKYLIFFNRDDEKISRYADEFICKINKKIELLEQEQRIARLSGLGDKI